MISQWFVQSRAALNGRWLGLVLLFAFSIGYLPLWPQQATAVGTVYYVKPAASGTGDGSSWADAATLQGALGDAAGGDEIWVAAGEYVPSTTDENVSFHLVPGVAVYGGFDGTEAAREERDWAANLTILSGDIGDDDANKVNGVVTDTADIVGINSYHVIHADGRTGTPITDTTILDGFTLTAGQADGNWPENLGGGFLCAGSLAGSDCSPTLTNVSFYGNYADQGGAMFNDGRSSGGSSPSLTNISFSGNRAGGCGGAMFNYGRDGGSSSPSLTNVSFSGNTAYCGGGMYNLGASGGSSSPSLSNVIMWGNWHEIINSDASTTISYSLIEGLNPTGDGNLDGTDAGNDPLFVDSAGGDLRLQPGSPAIDAGDNSVPGLAGILTDLDSSDRFADGDGDGIAAVDMGAYESQTQKIALAGGWDLISLYRQPDDPAPGAVLAGIETELVVLKNGQGQVYWPVYGVDQIGSWMMAEGYQIYLTAPATLAVSGAQVYPAQTPVSLGAGWNMVAYLRDSSMAIETALAGINGELLLVKNGAGQVYWPAMSIYDIGDMEPGQGYKMYMNSGATLTYPGN